MPRIPFSRAIATRDSVANLFAHAERHGEAIVLLPSEAACYRMRNALYGAVSKSRRHARELTGSGKGMYDDFAYSFFPYEGLDEAYSGWYQFLITHSKLVEFILLVPDWYDEAIDGPLPVLDLAPEELPLEDLQDLSPPEGSPYPHDDTYNPEPQASEDDSIPF